MSAPRSRSTNAALASSSGGRVDDSSEMTWSWVMILVCALCLSCSASKLGKVLHASSSCFADWIWACSWNAADLYWLPTARWYRNWTWSNVFSSNQMNLSGGKPASARSTTGASLVDRSAVTSRFIAGAEWHGGYVFMTCDTPPPKRGRSNWCAQLS